MLKTITVYSREHLSQDLGEFIAEMRGLLAEIPEEHRPSATIEIEGFDDGHGCESCCLARITVEYQRPETAEEEDRRASHWREMQAQNLARAHAEYERLKKMFEDAK